MTAHLTRRNFLQISAAGALSLSVPFSSAKEVDRNIRWDKSFDVVVVGGGYAGLATAVTAKRTGKTVALIDKRAWLGGDGVLSSGIFYSARTKFHDEAGITKNVSVDDYWKQICAGIDDEPLAKVRDNSRNSPVYFGVSKHNPEVLRKAAKYSPKVIDFVHSYGIKFLPMNPAKPFQLTVEKPAVSLFAQKMVEELEKSKVPVMTMTRVTELLTNKGAVVGVKAQSTEGGKPMFIKGRSIVLATGGFLDNEALMQRYKRFWCRAEPAISAVGEKRAKDRTGDGIVMAKSIGAALEEMESMPKLSARTQVGIPLVSWTIFDVEPSYLVSTKAKRVVDEHVARYSGACLALLRVGEPYGHVIFGQQTFEGPNRRRFRFDEALKKKGLFKADTPEELAAKVGLDPKELRKTIDKINADAAKGEDTQFGRKDRLFKPLAAPYYITARGYPIRYKTEGGLEVNPDFQVLRADNDQPIPGLYAVGATCGSITSRISDAVASGLIVGLTASGLKAP